MNGFISIVLFLVGHNNKVSVCCSMSTFGGHGVDYNWHLTLIIFSMNPSLDDDGLWLNFLDALLIIDLVAFGIVKIQQEMEKKIEGGVQSDHSNTYGTTTTTTR